MFTAFFVFDIVSKYIKIYQNKSDLFSDLFENSKTGH